MPRLRPAQRAHTDARRRFARNTVPRDRQQLVSVVAPGTDGVDDVGGTVVERGIRAEGLDVGEVGRGACRGDAVAG